MRKAIHNLTATMTWCLLLALSDGLQAQTLQRTYTSTQPPLAAGERLLKPMVVDIKVAASGQVTAVRPDPSIPASIADVLTRSVRGWQYTPAARNGVPVDSAARMTLMLVAVPLDKGMALRVSRASLASVWLPETASLAAPVHPLPHRRSKSYAVLVLAEPKPDRTGLTVVSMLVDGEPAKNGDVYAKAAKTALQRWKLEVLEWDGQYFPTQVCIPVNFHIDPDTESAPATNDDETTSPCEKMAGARNDDGIELKSKVAGNML